MLSTINSIGRNIRRNIGYTIGYGFLTGFIFGCFAKNASLHYKNKRIQIPIPLITGFIGSIGIIMSPFVFVSCFNNLTYFDKLIDVFADNYNFNVERIHQYDETNNKYAFPSLITLNIEPKSNINNIK
jgi:hypothetical protein